MLGHPFEVEGIVVEGDRRGKTLGFPTANLDVPRISCCRRKGSTPARRSATAPRSRSASTRTTAARALRVEAHLLDFDGDLYGRRLVVELWQRLRDERAFASEAELVDAIAADVEAARAAPAQAMDERAAAPRVGGRSVAADRADAAEVMV